MTCGIYAIRHVASGKFYIGSSVRIENRWSTHRSKLRAGTHHCRYLQNAWDKYGEASFRFEIIEVTERDKEILFGREQAWIDALNGLYNLAPVSRNNLGVRQIPDEQRINIGKGAAASFKYFSPDARAAISATHLGKPQSPEHIAKRSNAMRGKKRGPLSPEHKEKLSIVSTGKKRGPMSLEARANMSASRTGKKLSDEHRETLSRVRRGRKLTAEHRAAISAGHIRHHENKRKNA